MHRVFRWLRRRSRRGNSTATPASSATCHGLRTNLLQVAEGVRWRVILLQILLHCCQSPVWRNVAASTPQLELAVLLSVYVEPPHSSYRLCYCHWPPAGLRNPGL